jgi:GNAT superfamily N-acetyltransferase
MEPVTVRPIRPGDRAGIQAMWRRCSFASRLGRFHSPVREIPASYLDAIEAPPTEVVALVATDGRDIVALGSIHRTADGAVDLGLLVEDAWQQRGVGRQLIEKLAVCAWSMGGAELRADVSGDRVWVAEMLRRHLDVYSVTVDHGVFHLVAALAPGAP